MRINHLVLIGITACATEPAVDLGEIVDGKGDLSTIDVPLVLDPGTSERYTLTADRGFQVRVTATEARIEASVGGQSWASSTEPAVLVELPAGPPQTVDIVISNPTDHELRGRLQLGPAPETCPDELYLSWLETARQTLIDVGGFIEPTERARLDAVLATRPCASTSDPAYVAWFTWYRQAFLDAGGFLEQPEEERLAFIAAAQPAATGDGAWGTWFPFWIETLEGAGGLLEQPELARLGLLAAIRPLGRGDSAYASWGDAMAKVAGNAGGILEENERPILETLLGVKPCAAVSPATQATLAKIAAAMQTDVAAVFLARVAPEACTP